MRKPPPERAVCVFQNQLRFFMASCYLGSLGVKLCLSGVFFSLLGSSFLSSLFFQALRLSLSFSIVHIINSGAVKVLGGQTS